MMPVTLLFVHGGGFCKKCWDPIVRRLRATPLLAGAEFVTFDFTWHGESYDHSVAAQVDRSNPEKPRVDHPARNIETWAPQQVWEQVQQIRADQRARGQSDKTPLIGVGHSMGATALWKTEVTHPGTFASLSLFEPGYGVRKPENDFTAEDYLNIRNNLFLQVDRWDRAGYVRGGLIDQDDGSVVLACHPLIEASLYCHTPLHLNDELQQRPRCRVTFHGGGRSKIHNGKAFGQMAARYPDIYRTRPLMSGLSHALVMEDPAQCANAVVTDLEELSRGQTLPHSRM
ncbi:Alpha/beta hydrolase family [Phytophthora infestans]|uniref:Alpha/beta hydrolase family n=1 Tax=Phytophthora infestans TaxID=4787 RepID=A0A833W5F2_PHYIN|nr:Alpha/beta hydrolase family [Phytophthora infestans]